MTTEKYNDIIESLKVGSLYKLKEPVAFEIVGTTDLISPKVKEIMTLVDIKYDPGVSSFSDYCVTFLYRDVRITRYYIDKNWLEEIKTDDE